MPAVSHCAASTTPMRRHDRFASTRQIQSLTTNVRCDGTVPCDHHSTNVRHLPAIVRSRRSASGQDGSCMANQAVSCGAPAAPNVVGVCPNRNRHSPKREWLKPGRALPAALRNCWLWMCWRSLPAANGASRRGCSRSSGGMTGLERRAGVARIGVMRNSDRNATLRICRNALLRMCDIALSVKCGGAHAPPLPNFQTGMPSFLALSARLS